MKPKLFLVIKDITKPKAGTNLKNAAADLVSFMGLPSKDMCCKKTHRVNQVKKRRTKSALFYFLLIYNPLAHD